MTGKQSNNPWLAALNRMPRFGEAGAWPNVNYIADLSAM